MASIDAETKNKISHRGKASKNFIEKFKKIGS
jgi:inosine/xanthosine triphosphate pyrophosphatase family protein